MAKTFPISVPITGIDRLSGKLGSMGKSLSAFGKKATKAGKTLTLGVTAPVVGFGALAISTAAGFEKSMNRVEALTGAPGQALEALENQAKDLGGATEFSARQAAEAMGFLAQSGQDVGEIGKTLPPVLALASAAQLDLATTADLTTNILKGYGKGAEEASTVTNILAEATTKGNTDLEQLSEAMKLAGPVAKGFGQEFTTTVAILDKMADAGFQGTLGGTALRGGIVKLSEAASKSSPILKSLGIASNQIFDDQGNMRDMIDVIELLKVKGISATQTMSLFGQRAGPAMINLISGSTEEIRDLAGVLGHSNDGLGRALEIQAIQLKGAAGDVVNLKSRFEALQIAIGESGLLDLFAQGVQLLTKLVDRIKEADPKFIKLGLVIAGVASVIGPALVLIGMMATGIGGIATAFGVVMPILSTFATFIVGTAIPATLSFTAALLTNPVVLITLAIVALIAAGVLLVKNWDLVKKKAGQVWGAIKFGVGATVDWIRTQVASLVDLVPDWLVSIFTGGLTNATEIASAIRGRDVDQGRVTNSVAGGGANASATVGGRIGIKVQAPAGTEITQEGSSDIPIDVDTGLNLGGAAA